MEENPMAAQEKPRVYSVSQVNHHISSLFRDDQALAAIFVKGELSNVKYAGSGHLYFSLKDENCQIRCAMWASDVRKMSERVKDGESVIVFGQIAVYERDGTYQLYAKAIRKEGGIGILYERFEALKKQLLEMGMFDESYKKPIPRYIHTLGVVTARTGAAVRDIINVSQRRNPGIQIILYPATVQGDGAADTIVSGIEALDALGTVDVIIIGRGGGSIEDLWAFNEEKVARAIFRCNTPIISAVGHETDTTIADYVADLRAPTPSAGAELAVDDMSEVLTSLKQLEFRLHMLMQQNIERIRKTAKEYSLLLQLKGPVGRLQESEQFLIRISERMEQAITFRMNECREKKDRYTEMLSRLMQMKLNEAYHRLELSGGRLSALSPQAKLDAGYAYIENSRKKAVRDASSVIKGDSLNIYMKDGIIEALVTDVTQNASEE